MTYNEWRDELKSNLLCVPESEMLRVLDYYAEAYADRRDAGYSEREITAEFGAPYDAAQRILSESVEYPVDKVEPRPDTQYYHPKDQEPAQEPIQEFTQEPTQEPTQNTQSKSSDNSLAFVLLCVVFAIPIFSIFMTLVGITIGFSAAPFALILSGAGSIVEGIVEMFSDVALGAATIGIGLVLLGLGLMLAPIFFKIVRLLWKSLTKFFMWIKSLTSGKENA